MIYEANRNVVEDPHWIYPGEVLVIPPISPVGARPQGDPLGVPFTGVAVAVEPEPAEEPAVLNTVDLRHPLVPPAEYRSTPWISPATTPLVRGRLVRLGDPSEADDRIPAMVHPNYRVHIGDLRDTGSQPGDSLLVVRFGDMVPGFGQVVEPLAILRVDSLYGSTFSAQVVTQMDESRIGDRVIALDAFPEIPRGERTPVSGGAEGTLLRFQVEQELYGTGDLAFINLGEGHVRIGDEIAISVPARRVDETSSAVVPPTEVARAVVVRVAGRTSTVRLTRVTDTSLRNGLPVQLVARAP
jgi:hypothetical protein